jgi:dCTP deaminase
MILSSKEILTKIETGQISVMPQFERDQLRPFGLRVHLATTVMRIQKQSGVIDLRDESPELNYTKEAIDANEKPLVIEPGEFMLGSTVESFKLDSNMVARLDGRSTLARIGITIHCTAATVDGNHDEHRSIVLEIYNHSNKTIKIPAGYPIGMLLFEEARDSVVDGTNQSQYGNQSATTGSNFAFLPPSYDPK